MTPRTDAQLVERSSRTEEVIVFGQAVAAVIGGLLLTIGAWRLNPAVGMIVLGTLLLAEALSIKPGKLPRLPQKWRPPYRPRRGKGGDGGRVRT